MTQYVILREKTDASWEVFAYSVEASSDKRAIKAAAKEEGEYVAVPERSWNRRTIGVKTKTEITVS